MVSAEGREGLLGAAGGADDLDLGQGREQPGQAVTEDGMVVDDEDPGHAGTAVGAGDTRGRSVRRGRGLGGGGQPGLHRDARRGAGHGHRAAEFLGPLPHDGQAVAVMVRRTEPGAVVGDGDGQAGRGVIHRHLAVPGLSVPDRVGDRLYHDAVRGDLDGGRKGGQVVADADADGEPAPAVSRSTAWAHAPARPSSSRAGGRSPSTSRRTSTTVRRISSPRSCSCREARSAPGGSSARAVSVFRVRPGQGRPDAVVQVPAQAAPFLLAGQHQALPGPLQVLAEQPRMQRAAELPGQVTQQPLLGGAQLTIRRPVGQVPDGLGKGLQGDDRPGAFRGVGRQWRPLRWRRRGRAP